MRLKQGQRDNKLTPVAEKASLSAHESSVSSKDERQSEKSIATPARPAPQKQNLVTPTQKAAPLLHEIRQVLRNDHTPLEGKLERQQEKDKYDK